MDARRAGSKVLDRKARCFAAAAVCSAVLFVSSQGAARPEFPGIIQEEVPEMECPPPCLVCHSGPVGTAANFHGRAFAKNFNTAYLAQQGGSTSDRARAAIRVLAAAPVCPFTTDPGCNADPAAPSMCTAPCDADDDGESDFDELRAGRDPTEPGAGNVGTCVKYGCGARIAPNPPGNRIDTTALLAAFGVLGMLLARFRRSPKR